MCAASPARKRRPCCIGSATKLRMPVTPFSRTGPSFERPARRARSARASSSQIALVGPLREVLVRAALEVEAAERRRAQAEQGEAALVVGVDELVARRRRRRRGCRASRTGTRARTCAARPAIAGAADAVEAVAAGDHVAVEPLLVAVVREADPRRLATRASCTVDARRPRRGAAGRARAAPAIRSFTTSVWP